ncbi:hypothetical protein [Rossellomorea marisflavi]|uniref:hypothetical protein n=1 Tax=Rossellomorea marisflavi TaxID=189381 RepID=UPI003FA0AE88
MEKQEKNYFGGKMPYTMSGEHNWEKKGGTKGACRQCGQYIKNDEDYYLVIINWADVRQDFPKEGNFIIHQKEFDTLVDVTGSESNAVYHIFSHKKPRAKNPTQVDEERVERFKGIVARRGFRIKSETKNRITFTPGFRDKSPYIFDKRFGTIEYSGRGMNGLFDGLIIKEFVSRIREELYDIPKEQGFRALDVVEKATKQVDEWMGK